MNNFQCKYCNADLISFDQIIKKKYYTASHYDAFVCLKCDVGFLFHNDNLFTEQIFRDKFAVYLAHGENITRIHILPAHHQREILVFEYILPITLFNFDQKMQMILNFQ